MGNFCGFHTSTGRCWVACNPWSNLPDIVASFHQWHTVAWGVCLFASDVFLYTPVPESVLRYSVWWKQESADKKFGNMAGYRHYKRATRSWSSFWCYWLWPFLMFLIECILGGESNWAQLIMLQPSDSTASSTLWQFAFMVQSNISLWTSSLQSLSSSRRFKLVRLNFSANALTVIRDMLYSP